MSAAPRFDATSARLRWRSRAAAGSATRHVAVPSVLEGRGDEAPDRVPMTGLDSSVRKAATLSGPQSVEVRPEALLVIEGEMFAVRIEDGMVTIAHQRWSLFGSGATLRAAEDDLWSELGEVATVMLAQHSEDLSPDANQLRNFALTHRR